MTSGSSPYISAAFVDCSAFAKSPGNTDAADCASAVLDGVAALVEGEMQAFLAEVQSEKLAGSYDTAQWKEPLYDSAAALDADDPSDAGTLKDKAVQRSCKRI